MTENELQPLRDALEQGVEYFSLVADAMPLLIWVARGDGKIIYYNRRWLAYTGLGVEETNRNYGSAKGVVHPGDLATLWTRWSEALATGAPYETEYRLRSATDGSYRWFIARASPIRDATGAIAQWIGTCTDIDEQRRARDTLEYIAQASDVLFASFDLDRSLQRLVEILVPRMADIAAVMLVDADGALRMKASAHRDPAKAKLVQKMHGERMLTPEAERREIARLSEHRPRVIEDFNLAAGRAQLWPYIANALSPLHPRSSVTIPLHARGVTYGGLYLYSGTDELAYDARDLPLFLEVGHRASIAIENARSYERERRIAETYQRASLPLSIASPKGLRVDAIFMPGSAETEIGGDWYDSTLMRDGSLLVSVGDVMGRGLPAAAIMARIRQVINVAAMYESDPARVLDTADHIVREGFPELMITAFVGLISADRKTLRYANAGHRPPFLRRHGALVELNATGLPLGVRNAIAVGESQSTNLEGAELLVLYTDGLVDNRVDPDAGENRLREVLSNPAVLFAHAPARLIHEACVHRAVSDDVAILTIRLGDTERWSFSTQNAQAANDARADFVRFLQCRSQDARSVESAEVVFGELVGNVVRHAPGPVDVTLEWGEGAPVLHVIDRGAAFERRARLPDDMMSEGGRGLFIAQHLSAGFGVQHVPGYGNHVWAQLQL
jgi:PAS domain S-box-containing protein